MNPDRLLAYYEREYLHEKGQYLGLGFPKGFITCWLVGLYWPFFAGLEYAIKSQDRERILSAVHELCEFCLEHEALIPLVPEIADSAEDVLIRATDALVRLNANLISP